MGQMVGDVKDLAEQGEPMGSRTVPLLPCGSSTPAPPG